MAEQVLQRLHHALAGHYLLDREIGHGGMATVYLAQDLRLGRRVAVKVLRPELAAVVGPERFLREIETTARLTHPNILPLHDSGQADGLLYYVMPYVEGETLRDRLRREGALPLEDALRIATEVADALAYAHRQGIIHRDVKPANILLAGDHALVADFGLAKALAATTTEAELSQSGLVVGTPEYMSPEQASGESHIDGRADVYALGCVLYEMLVGEPPFRGNTAQTILARHRGQPAPSVRVVRPELPVWVEELIRRALAKMPADRHRSAGDFHAALVAGVAGKGGQARRVRPVLVGLVLLVGAALAWQAVARRTPPADSNKVMGFPLVELGLVPGGASEGELAAIMIGRALEHTDPLKWIDGWSRVPLAVREDIRLLGPEETRRVALQSGSRFYLDGRVLHAGDSVAVLLFLHDALADTLIGQASAAGRSGTVATPTLALRATIQLLPKLLPPGRVLDREALDFLLARAPAAVANWLQGEREYRAARFEPALDRYRHALESDSALAFAAFKAAQAANWLERDDEAAVLVQQALRYPSLLPPKYLDFARGLRAYLAGEADSAAVLFDRVIARDSAWAEAWAARGEVYYHLLPRGEDLVETADGSFRSAHERDPEFSPPLFHLAELAVRKGALRDARQYLDVYRKSDPAPDFLGALDLMLACAKAPLSPGEWARHASQRPEAVKEAARSLAIAARHPECAEGGFRAVLAAGNASDAARWAALLGLHNLLVAQGRLASAQAALDSAMGGALAGGASFLYIVDAVAGYGMDSQAAALITRLGGQYDAMSPARLWLLGLWAWRRGDRQTLVAVNEAISTAAARTTTVLDQAFATGIASRVRLVEGDTAGAIASLSQLRPVATRPNLAGGVWEALAGERLLLAQLHRAQGRYEAAAKIAEEFDRPHAIMYLLHLRATLEIRRDAEDALHRDEGSAERLRRLIEHART